MKIHTSNKNWFEKLAEAIPGIGPYRERMDLRDVDKRLRTWIAQQIYLSRVRLEEHKNDIFEVKKPEALERIDRLCVKLQKLEDSIKYAEYGYAGVFDKVKIKKPELQELFKYDVRFVDEAKKMEGLIESLNPHVDNDPIIKELSILADQIYRAIAERKNYFSRPIA